MKQYCCYQSPIGQLLLVGADGVLEELHFANSPAQEKIVDDCQHYQHDQAGFANVIQQLSEYFSGRRQEFDLTISPKGTVFQQRIWQELQKNPLWPDSQLWRHCQAGRQPESKPGSGHGQQ